MHTLLRILSLFEHPSPDHLFLATAVVVIGAAVIWLLLRLSVPTLMTATIVAEVFSGNWNYMGLPPIDRILLVLTLLAMVVRGVRAVSSRRLVLQPIHFLLLGVAAYVTANSLWSGSLTTSQGFYALLDRLGLIPFLAYTIAPLIFGSKKQLNVLLIGMVGVGIYLGIEAICEGLHLTSLVFPRYINNQSIGITKGRARGPFLASDALGLSLLDCAAFASVALTQWRRWWARWACYGVIAMAAVGIFFTLTRSVWLGTVVAVLAVMLWRPNLRKMVLPLGAALAVLTGLSLLFLPGLATKTTSRIGDISSVWDRYNTNYAALRMLASHPLFGVGWHEFAQKSWAYLREAGTYPLTGTGLSVHNVFLSHLAEIGVIGAVLWTLALVSGVGGPLLRRCSPELAPWKLGLVPVLCCFLVVANLSPLSYPFPNLILWLWGGIVARDRNSTVRVEHGLLGVEEDIDVEQDLAGAVSSQGAPSMAGLSSNPS